MVARQVDLVAGLSESLAAVWSRAVRSAKPDSIAELWSLEYTKVPDTVRSLYAVAGPEDQSETIDSLHDLAGDYWTDWAMVRLSNLEPFRYWCEWRRPRPAPGPAVGIAEPGGNGCMLPMRVFLLPREVGVITEDDPSSRSKCILPQADPVKSRVAYWPYRSEPINAIRHVPSLLRWCLARNLLGMAGDWPFMALVTLNVVSLAALITWGARSEALIEPLLAISFFLSGSLVGLFGWNIIREFILVRREGWFQTWNGSLLRIVGDARQSMTLRGRSHEVAAAFESCVELAKRVLSRIGPGGRSRFARAMAGLRDSGGAYAATGQLGGPLGLWIRPVGDIGPKREAVDQAELGRFVVPLTWSVIGESFREAFRRPERHRARLCGGISAPVALLKLAGVYQGSSFLWAILMVLSLVPGREEFRMLSRMGPPRFHGPARWWLRTGMRRDLNLLQISFDGVSGDPAEYFVICEGSTGETNRGSDPSEREPANSLVASQSLLMPDSTHFGGAVADLSFRSNAGTPDPHLLKVVLFQRRSLAGFPLPPARVLSFGLSEVEVQP